jgi:hypothetical protein
MLTHLAGKMNATHAVHILTQSLSEERSMADWIKTNTLKWFYNCGLKLRVQLLWKEKINTRICVDAFYYAYRSK